MAQCLHSGIMAGVPDGHAQVQITPGISLPLGIGTLQPGSLHIRGFRKHGQKQSQAGLLAGCMDGTVEIPRRRRRQMVMGIR
jgi:hypothetical protein